MREIKFRVWDGSQWSYFKIGQTWGSWMESVYTDHCLNGRTFYQFTGLKDKNGREIYEGDIVRYSDQLDEGIAVIEQHKHSDIIPYLVMRYTVNGAGMGDYNFDYLHGGPSHEYEVIGNIHENGNLLTDGV